MTQLGQGGADRAFAQWDALVALVQNETVTGGRLAGIANVERVVPVEQSVFPAIGVQFESYDERPNAQRQHLLVAQFSVFIVVVEKFDETAPISDMVRAAYDRLRNFVNDGNGNGFAPIIRSNPRLSGLVIRSMIRSLRYAAFRSDTEGAETYATALFTVETLDKVNF